LPIVEFRGDLGFILKSVPCSGRTEFGFCGACGLRCREADKKQQRQQQRCAERSEFLRKFI
jgi:hypothetical protein